MSALENNLSAVLNYTPRIGCIKPPKTSRIANIIVRDGSFGMVPEIKRFNANLEPGGFGYPGSLEQRHICVPNRGSLK